MAAHAVAADFVAEAGGALDVYLIARLQCAQIGFGQRFAHQVEIRRAVFVHTGDGEAAAVVRHRCAHAQIGIRALGQAHGVAAEIGHTLIHGQHFTQALYDSCEHGFSLIILILQRNKGYLKMPSPVFR